MQKSVADCHDIRFEEPSFLPLGWRLDRVETLSFHLLSSENLTIVPESFVEWILWFDLGLVLGYWRLGRR